MALVMATRKTYVDAAFLGIFCLCACLATQVTEGQQRGAEKGDGAKGGHPLNDDEKRPTLEDLLNAADWPTPAITVRPRAAAFPNPQRRDNEIAREEADPEPPRKAPPAQESGRDAWQLVADRNRLVDEARVFETLENIYREEEECGRRHSELQLKLGVQRRAANNVDYTLSLGKKATAEAVARARAAFEKARRETEHAHRSWMEKIVVLQPLYQRIRPALAEWMLCYQELHGLLQSDRRDPSRGPVLDALDQAVKSRNDFYEGRVLAALAEIYEGRTKDAIRNLAKACEGFRKYRLFGTVFAHDCCHAYLLLGKTDMVKEYVTNVQKLEANRQTSVRCWLVGVWATLECRDHEADVYYRRALAKTKVLSHEEPVSGLDPLLGDAACFYLTASNPKRRDGKFARIILQKAADDSDDWRVVRARAAVAASEGQWERAVALTHAVCVSAPPTMDGELALQLEAYRRNEEWTRARPGAKAVPAPDDGTTSEDR